MRVQCEMYSEKRKSHNECNKMLNRNPESNHTDKAFLEKCTFVHFAVKSSLLEDEMKAKLPFLEFCAPTPAQVRHCDGHVFQSIFTYLGRCNTVNVLETCSQTFGAFRIQ